MIDGNNFETDFYFESIEFNLAKMVKAIKPEMVEQCKREKYDVDRFIWRDNSLIIEYKKKVFINHLTPEKWEFLLQFRHKHKDLLEDY